MRGTVAGVETDVAMTTVRIASTSGAIRVIAEERSDVEVPDSVEYSVEESTTTVNAGSRRVTVRVPEGTNLVIGSASGRVEVVGRVGSVAVVTTFRSGVRRRGEVRRHQNDERTA